MPEGSLCRVACRGQALHRTRFEFLVSFEDVSSIRRKESALERDEPEYHRQIFCLCNHLHGVGFKVL